MTTNAWGEIELQPLTWIQRVVARRLAEANATVPHFALCTEVRWMPRYNFAPS